MSLVTQSNLWNSALLTDQSAIFAASIAVGRSQATISPLTFVDIADIGVFFRFCSPPPVKSALSPISTLSASTGVALLLISEKTFLVAIVFFCE